MSHSANAADYWLAKREAIVRTIWDDGKLPLHRTSPDRVERTNVSGVTKLTWDISAQPSGHIHQARNASAFFSLAHPRKRAKAAAIYAHGHSWENWRTPAQLIHDDDPQSAAACA